jgi:hypothetical protein
MSVNYWWRERERGADQRAAYFSCLPNANVKGFNCLLVSVGIKFLQEAHISNFPRPRSGETQANITISSLTAED